MGKNSYELCDIKDPDARNWAVVRIPETRGCDLVNSNGQPTYVFSSRAGRGFQLEAKVIKENW